MSQSLKGVLYTKIFQYLLETEPSSYCSSAK